MRGLKTKLWLSPRSPANNQVDFLSQNLAKHAEGLKGWSIHNVTFFRMQHLFYSKRKDNIWNKFRRLPSPLSRACGFDKLNRERPRAERIFNCALSLIEMETENEWILASRRFVINLQLSDSNEKWRNQETFLLGTTEWCQTAERAQMKVESERLRKLNQRALQPR